MAAGRADDDAALGPRRFSRAVLAAAVVLFVLVAPLAEFYAVRLFVFRGAFRSAAALVAGAVLLAGLAAALARFPRSVAVLLAAVAAFQIAATGNAAAFLEAGAIFAFVLLLGDAVAHAARGERPAPGEWPSTLAAGAAAASLLVLGLGEAGALRPSVLAAFTAAILAFRGRRIAEYVRAAFRAAPSVPGREEPRALRAAWLALSVAAFAVVWLRVLGPDLSWDALAYHLPEARDVARTLAVRVVPDLFPQSLLWRMHENFLALGFFLPSGERVVQFLNFGIGIAAFGATALLARRIGGGASPSLVFLALTGFPVILFQLHSSYADWPAAAFVAAAAAEIAASRDRPRRAWLGAALFGAAVATKPYALCAAPALAILFARRGNLRPGRTAAAVLISLLPVVPWMAWSARHSGSPLAPVSSHSPNEVESLPGGILAPAAPGAPSGRSGPPHSAPAVADERSAAGFLSLPYDLTFHSSRFQGFRDGYFGLLALLLAIGVFGWRPVPALLFGLSAAAALLPWYFGPSPSVRYLFPVYPLYAAFAAAGLSRGTGRFAGRTGLAAGAALAAAVLALPVGFDPKPAEVLAAFGRIGRDDVLARQLPAFPLWKFVRGNDRAVLIGEYDRFHCPAALAYRTKYIPVRLWGGDPAAWRRELRRFGITVVVCSSSADRAPLIAELARGGDLRLVAENRGMSIYRVAAAPGPRGAADYNGGG